jgi:outer membrane protein assembly factor BamB
MHSLKQLIRYTVLLAMPLLGGCEKGLDTIICEDGSTTPPTTIPASITVLTRELGAKPQTFSYDPTRQNRFTGLKGTIITIPANAFVRGNGAPITGPIELEVREVFSKADMVLTGTPTSSNGQLLESAGEIYLQPALDSSLRLSPQASIQFLTQNPPNLSSTDSMRLFSGSGGGGCFTWEPVFDPGSSLRASGNGYQVNVSSALYNSGIGWFNCDRFYGAPSPLSVAVDVQGDNIDPKVNTMVFVVFKTLNGSLRACTFTAPNTFSTGGVPSGSAVSVVVIRTLNGKLLYGRQDGTVTASQRFSPTMREVTTSELKADLNSI